MGSGCVARLRLVQAGMACVVAASMGSAALGQVTETRARLDELLKSRSGWRGLRVDWTLLDHAEIPSPRFYHTCQVGEDSLQADLGDSDGVIARNEAGSPQEGWFGPNYSLQIGNELWIHGEGHIRADVFDGFNPQGMGDFRTLGLSYERFGGNVKAIENELAAAEVTTRSEGACEIVRAAYDGRVVSWYLRPDRGWLPERVTLSAHNRLIAESRSELVESQGAWQPSIVRFFRADYHEGREPVETIQIDGLEVNPPDLPENLSPAHIGIDAGVNLYVRTAGSGAPAQFFKWDGEQRVTLKEFGDRCRSGELQVGERFAANVRRYQERAAGRPPEAPAVARSSAAATTRTELETRTGWAAYTEQFIADYQLDSEQAQRARSILRQCQDRGEVILRLREPTIRDLDSEARAPHPNHESLDQRRRRVMAPFAAIFENDLKPRLAQLPTRAQRERQASSQPSRARP